MPPAMSYELQASSCKLQASNYEPQVMSYEISDTSYKLRDTRHKIAPALAYYSMVQASTVARLYCADLHHTLTELS
jgi:hypothetical protein